MGEELAKLEQEYQWQEALCEEFRKQCEDKDLQGEELLAENQNLQLELLNLQYQFNSIKKELAEAREKEICKGKEEEDEEIKIEVNPIAAGELQGVVID